MLRLRPAVALIPLALIAACSAPAAPSPDVAVGRWRSAPEPLSPRGTMVSELTFTPASRFSFEVRSFGVYPQQSENELSASSRTVGRYRIDGRRLHLQPDSLIESDAFDPNTGVVVTTPYPYSPGPFDQATITVSADRLTLNYLSYPADAPIPSEGQFRRVSD